ncbi:MAG: hypothetical protein K2P50_07115 [Lachnospiraceae bacterium]|nr:hypothetical protein [Lachnospiraceae bacterium]
MRFGVQLFGPGNLCRENPERFFKLISEACYQLIEPCLWAGERPEEAKDLPVWTIEELTSMQPLYQKYNLKILSCHLFAGPEDDLPPAKIQKLYEDFGITGFVITGHSETTREGCLAYAEKLRRLAGELPSPIRLLLHNGQEESLARIDGKTAYEFLLDCCCASSGSRPGSPKGSVSGFCPDNDTGACHAMVGAQPDVGWLLYGGEDAEAFLWRNKDRIFSLHYKDFAKKEDGALAETAIGKGLIDMKACFQFARAMELPQFADMDGSENDFLTDIQNTGQLFRSLTQCRDNTRSILCICDAETGEVTKLREFDRIIEAPNWLKDGDTIIYNSEGYIWNYRISEDRECKIPSGECTNCNNDHVLSPDHSQIAVSHSQPGTWESKIYILPVTGGTPRLVTPKGPSYLHGWSPDGKELAYCAFREKDGALSVDIYSISAEKGNESGQEQEEKQLTGHAAFNDGPEYDPDGKHIWFNSTRTGLMQIWKMDRDGENQTQMTFEEQNNWFAHVSPDGEKVVNLSYSKEGLDADEHLPNMQVSLWTMKPDGTDRKKLLDFFGGQGSVNVNSWSPDSRRFAFVAYELMHR